MVDAIVLTILGMGTVVIVLYIISLMIRLMGKVVGSKKPAAAAPAAAPKAAAPAAAAPKADDTKVIAVITAAIAAYLGTSPSNLVVRPVCTSSNWGLVGRMENTKKLY